MTDDEEAKKLLGNLLRFPLPQTPGPPDADSDIVLSASIVEAVLEQLEKALNTIDGYSNVLRELMAEVSISGHLTVNGKPMTVSEFDDYARDGVSALRSMVQLIRDALAVIRNDVLTTDEKRVALHALREIRKPKP